MASWGWKGREAPFWGLTGQSPWTIFFWDRTFTDLDCSCTDEFLVVFMINVIFRSEKHWTSFDVGKVESSDDGDADTRTATHDHSRNPFINLKIRHFTRTAIAVADQI